MFHGNIDSEMVKAFTQDLKEPEGIPQIPEDELSEWMGMREESDNEA